MDTKKKQSYNLYKTNANENSTKLLFKNDKLSFNSTPRYKTSYSNSKANSKIKDKKYINNRDEILKKSKTTQYANNTRKINYNEKPKENTAQNLFNFTYSQYNNQNLAFKFKKCPSKIVYIISSLIINHLIFLISKKI